MTGQQWFNLAYNSSRIALDMEFASEPIDDPLSCERFTG